jgi:hypothetical protein
VAAAHAAITRAIADPASPMRDVARRFDDLSAPDRVAVVRRLDRRTQRTLYARAEGLASLTLVDLVAPERADLEEVRHLGLNTLPVFRVFEKRFCRLPGEDPAKPTALAGYNFQTMSPVTGPGYFMAVDDPRTAEVLVDYRRLPDRKPPGWPAIRSNERGLARFVYGFMVDRLRRVSEHVTIGSATRGDRELGSWFVLTRHDV